MHSCLHISLPILNCSKEIYRVDNPATYDDGKAVVVMWQTEGREGQEGQIELVLRQSQFCCSLICRSVRWRNVNLHDKLTRCSKSPFAEVYF